MIVTLKRLDLLIREIKDPYVQENFLKLREYLTSLSLNGVVGPRGPEGPAGPPGEPGQDSETGVATQSPKLVEIFPTSSGTAIGDLVRIASDRTVISITDNFSASIPNGVFGAVFGKPTTITAAVLFSGIMTGYTGFTPGSPIFVGANGKPTHTVQTSGMSQQIGFAISTSAFFLQLMQAMRRS